MYVVTAFICDFNAVDGVRGWPLRGHGGLYPVVLVPGIFDWRDGNMGTEALRRGTLQEEALGWQLHWDHQKLCWLEHLLLHNETGLDLPGACIRPVHGLVAVDYFEPGYFLWVVLIENLAKIGYGEKNMYMAAYDRRLSFQNTEGSSAEQTEEQLELVFNANGCKKEVVVPHSMGVNYFLHFLKWVKVPAPMVGRGG
ncbi:hypothetical protein MLD38_004060 [Melastoma candidum]|uniref:Uncharacterized protein n=1 Tax=Melastoma candidum TaxID=119954 RepID=A0ACB9S483_9MYRT|nr:hypothetical protein MLD38_004060 [Melastoma candidum]